MTEGGGEHNKLSGMWKKDGHDSWSAYVGWADCFEEEELKRHRLLRPGEAVNLNARRSTLYGPGINASSYGTVAMQYSFMMEIVSQFIGGHKLLLKEVSAASDFAGRLRLILPLTCI